MMHESTIVYCLQSDMTRVEYKLTPSLREWLWFVRETWFVVAPVWRGRLCMRLGFILPDSRYCPENGGGESAA